jgi:proliferating cell nuclear antigen
MSKILKCASNDDVITIRADDDADAVTFIFESPSKFFFFLIQKLH